MIVTCPKSKQIKLRILLSVAAYSYEFEDESLMTDHEFDALSKLVDPEISTGRPLLDHFFKTKFTDYSGQWIHHHPELHKVKNLYETYYAGKTISVEQFHKVYK